MFSTAKVISKYTCTRSIEAIARTKTLSLRSAFGQNYSSSFVTLGFMSVDSCKKQTDFGEG